MKETRKKALITLAVVAVIAVVCVLMSLRPVENFQEKYAGVNLEQDIAGVERDGTYAKYLAAHADATKPQAEVAAYPSRNWNRGSSVLTTRRAAAPRVRVWAKATSWTWT